VQPIGLTTLASELFHFADAVECFHFGFYRDVLPLEVAEGRPRLFRVDVSGTLILAGVTRTHLGVSLN
jgi:hypothetical protein